MLKLEYYLNTMECHMYIGISAYNIFLLCGRGLASSGLDREDERCNIRASDVMVLCLALFR